MFHSASPAWGDRNLRELSGEIASSLFLAHVRAATGTPVQETNCHPFGLGRWLFVHNGYIDGYDRLRRDMMLKGHQPGTSRDKGPGAKLLSGRSIGDQATSSGPPRTRG